MGHILIYVVFRATTQARVAGEDLKQDQGGRQGEAAMTQQGESSLVIR